jgi:hypothetical protein
MSRPHTEPVFTLQIWSTRLLHSLIDWYSTRFHAFFFLRLGAVWLGTLNLEKLIRIGFWNFSRLRCDFYHDMRQTSAKFRSLADYPTVMTWWWFPCRLDVCQSILSFLEPHRFPGKQSTPQIAAYRKPPILPRTKIRSRLQGILLMTKSTWPDAMTTIEDRSDEKRSSCHWRQPQNLLILLMKKLKDPTRMTKSSRRDPHGWR